MKHVAEFKSDGNKSAQQGGDGQKYQALCKGFVSFDFEHHRDPGQKRQTGAGQRQEYVHPQGQGPDEDIIRIEEVMALGKKPYGGI